MRRSILVIATLFVAGCTAQSTPPPSSAPEASPPAASDGGSAPSGPVVGSAVEGFHICPEGSADTPCPLPPGRYQTAGHDAVALTIAEDGWREEANPGEHPTLVVHPEGLPDHRVVLETGDTGGLLSDTELSARLDETVGFRVGDPVPVTIGGASGFAVDLAPQEAASVTLPGITTIFPMSPDYRYRLAVLQLPMDQESVVEAVLIQAPSSEFEVFLPRAEALLQMAEFSSGN